MTTYKEILGRQLGKNGPLVPRLGVGLMGASGTYGMPSADDVRLAFLDDAYNIGETFWDTADEYGDSEDLLGKWFAINPSKRKNIFLATKFGIRSDFSNPSQINVDSSPEYCKEALEKSLKRLGLDWVDLYYIHRLDKVTPIEKTMKAMVELKDVGKIKYIGLSECSANTLRRAYAVHPVACVQVEYSAFCRTIETNDLLKTARELGVAVVAYSPLGNGILTGTLRKQEDFTKPGDLRAHMPWLQGENLTKILAIIDELTNLAGSINGGASTPQLALAWLMAQGDDIFAIPGTKNSDRLKENMASLDLTISGELERKIRQLTSQVSGQRVNELTGFAFGDTPSL